MSILCPASHFVPERAGEMSGAHHYLISSFQLPYEVEYFVQPIAEETKTESSFPKATQVLALGFKSRPVCIQEWRVWHTLALSSSDIQPPRAEG